MSRVNVHAIREHVHAIAENMRVMDMMNISDECLQSLTTYREKRRVVQTVVDVSGQLYSGFAHTDHRDCQVRLAVESGQRDQLSSTPRLVNRVIQNLLL